MIVSEMERGQALTWVAGDRGVPQGQAARSGASHTIPSVSFAAAEPSKEAHETGVS